jgi:hypothetical protein
MYAYEQQGICTAFSSERSFQIHLFSFISVTGLDVVAVQTQDQHWKTNYTTDFSLHKSRNFFRVVL